MSIIIHVFIHFYLHFLFFLSNMLRSQDLRGIYVIPSAQNSFSKYNFLYFYHQFLSY
jgi:hypothetical protein